MNAENPRRLTVSPRAAPSPAFKVIPGTFFSASCSRVVACDFNRACGTTVTVCAVLCTPPGSLSLTSDRTPCTVMLSGFGFSPGFNGLSVN